MSKATNIHPVFDRIISREEKEELLKQKSIVLWMTGLSGSGKSTIAIGVEKVLHKKGFLTQILDGDNIRTGINNNLGFSEEDRYENIRRIAEISKLFLDCGIITINSFVSPTIEIRKQAKDIIGSNNFVEIYINVPLEIAEKRDVKGLYKKAREGKIKDFTGIDSPFEEPINPDIEIRTDELNIQNSIDKVLEKILPIINKCR
ncbi:MAG: adenylyl-sulfate kinase [Bacteroidetes bacterium]|jgi:adenylylsulfate kinase|nr:adenylyl-sulfate kinase [Bacteroidota bacterium]MBT6687277.1 adenylyl-sulfate kinase [Bacteroidota bacterium]MBT7144502.1 adenylyl-sulfate kinase [Bacteroidota bacterium]MBT7493069.1 adenylyl-sulfate kinase [Bacteroidota bacterium]